LREVAERHDIEIVELSVMPDVIDTANDDRTEVQSALTL
jgi:REP element-mobilizing transposase RayT